MDLDQYCEGFISEPRNTDLGVFDENLNSASSSSIVDPAENRCNVGRPGYTKLRQVLGGKRNRSRPKSDPICLRLNRYKLGRLHKLDVFHRQILE